MAKTAHAKYSVLIWLCLSLMLPACAAQQDTAESPSGWEDTSVSYGQGQLNLRVRFRWIAEAHPTGAVIHTPEGGEAFVRVFSCSKPLKDVKQQIRLRLRGQLVGDQFVDRKGLFTFRWWQKEEANKVMGVAVSPHGPLLIVVSSSTIQETDLAWVAKRTRLMLPVPTIPKCYPICADNDPECVPQGSEEMGQ